MKLTKKEMINAIIEWAMQSRENLDKTLEVLLDGAEETVNTGVRTTPFIPGIEKYTQVVFGGGAYGVKPKKRGRPPLTKEQKEQRAKITGIERRVSITKGNIFTLPKRGRPPKKKRKTDVK